MRFKSLLFLYLCCLYSWVKADSYCNGGKTLTAVTGTITDHTGSDNYNDGSFCYWEIKLPNDYEAIKLEVTSLDVEFMFDYIMAFDGVGDTSPLLSYWTGDLVSTPKISSGPSATILFYSDDMINGKGFTLTYQGLKCPGLCNGNGDCVNSTCHCYDGWMGATCNVTYCPNNCTGHGSCVNNQCVCQPGYYGGACNDAYCHGNTLYTAPNGIISDHHGGGNYKDNTLCSWLINSEPGTSISLKFNTFDIETNYDYLYIYDGPNENSTLLGQFTGNRLPPDVVATEGSMYIVFEVDPAITRRGFTATYTTQSCPNQCSGNGHCYKGACDCHPGWVGEDCSEAGCTANCTSPAHGTCMDSACHCDDPWSGIQCGWCSGKDCPNVYCSSDLFLLDSTGNFSDHTGVGTYLPNSMCSWTILPPDSGWTSIVLSFNSFDLDTGDYVTIYGENWVQLAQYTGSQIPPDVESISGEYSLTVIFQSNSDNTRTGFSASYKLLTCANNCNNNGDCVADGVCKCYPGWNGTTCEHQICAANCSGNGVCENNKCVCQQGYFGATCSDIFCSGARNYTDRYGVVIDHNHDLVQPYLEYSDCRFGIYPQPTPKSGVTAIFKSIQTETDVDFVTVSDGGPVQTVLLNLWSGSLVPSPVRTNSSGLVMSFTSNYVQQFSGFEAEYYSNDNCPQACLGRGYCVKGACWCDAGWDGENCSEVAVPKTLLPSISIQEVIEDLRWHYYVIPLSKSVGAFTIVISKTSNRGVLEVYGAKGRYPTEKDNDGGIRVFYRQVSYELIEENPEVGNYYIGIFSRSVDINTTYSLEMSYACPVMCEYGTCVNYVCVCDKCWGGKYCTEMVQDCGSEYTTGKGASKSATAGIIVGSVIISLVVVAIVAVVLVKWWKTRVPAGYTYTSEEMPSSRQSELTDTPHEQETTQEL